MNLSTRERESLISATAAVQANAAKVALLLQGAETEQQQKAKNEADRMVLASQFTLTLVKGVLYELDH
ncbi:hypothetical protein [uncultured Mobiluncus sp.]|uniref:hypothetical protein n=1 Tax=uncultured Mobiluncus sp. TaxID=293425 RepID=UPI0025EB71C9|nr:hypothetical protein [uncultured Mobiluncus sp.]